MENAINHNENMSAVWVIQDQYGRIFYIGGTESDVRRIARSLGDVKVSKHKVRQ